MVFAEVVDNALIVAAKPAAMFVVGRDKPTCFHVMRDLYHSRFREFASTSEAAWRKATKAPCFAMNA